MVNIQGSPPLISGEMHPNKEEVRQKHQACVDEQGPPGRSQTEKGSLQRVEARTDSLGEIQTNCSGSENIFGGR